MSRRRMSIERLALCHVAVTSSGTEAQEARERIALEEIEGLRFGSSFAETLLLSGPLLDLYEEEAHVIRDPEARELARFDSFTGPAAMVR